MNAQRTTPARRAAALAVAAAVSALHLWGAAWLAAEVRLGEGASDASIVRRIDVAFVRELQQAMPPPAPVPRARTPRAAQAPGRVASAPEPSAPPVEPEIAAQAPEPPPPAESASSPPLAADAAASAPEEGTAMAAASAPTASAPTGPAFEWPPSTRLSYTLTGNYQGPVDGTARVEWLRKGGRYQVHLEVALGPAFAPLASRRLSSEGELTDEGLRPLRYEEVTQVPLRAPRMLGVTLGPQRVWLANGQVAERPPGVQDTASQFVQLTWLFNTQPQRLSVGQTLEFPLALPRRLDRWTYDVVAEEVLETQAGRVLTYHLKPRPESRRGRELLVDTWIAPTLQYLPVRIRIEQDEQTWADLLIDRLPQQAAEPGTPTQ